MAEATTAAARISGLYAIADLPPPAGISAVDYATALLGVRAGDRAGAGPSVLQLRAKSASPDERASLLRALVPRCAAAGVLLIVNDDVDAALATVGVDGVHLGQEDLGVGSFAERRRRLDAIRRRAGELHRAPLLIGLSTHTLEQVREANDLPVDYLGFGPIFPTTSKRGADPAVGLASVSAAVALCDRPLVAIGGLDADRAKAASKAGASAVALIGALRGSSQAQIRSRVLALSDMLFATGRS